MNDTHPKIQALYDQLMQQKTPEERVRMGCSMHDFSKKIVLSQVLSPEKNIGEVMQDIFIRFYGGDFDEVRKSKILERVGNYYAKRS